MSAGIIRVKNPETPSPRAELLLVAADRDVEEALGIELDTERESKARADIFEDLRMERDPHPLEPLFQGRWQ